MKKEENRWDVAIADAEDSIARMARKIESLRFAIKLFKEKRDQGEQWEAA